MNEAKAEFIMKNFEFIDYIAIAWVYCKQTTNWK